MRRILAMAAILTAGAWWLAPAGPADPGIDPFVSASIAPAADRQFAIANLENRVSCEAMRGDAVTGRSLRFVPQPTCAEVWPGLAEARNWTENEDGSVILTKGTGEAILTITPGDGVDYEALDPQDAVVTLTRLR